MSKDAKYQKIAEEVLRAVGGSENVVTVTHCMTRLRFNLRDQGMAKDDEVRKLDGVVSTVTSGDQYQVIIGTTVSQVYAALCKLGNFQSEPVAREVTRQQDSKASGKITPKGILNGLFDYLSGSLTPLIPILLVASLCKTLAAVFGPQLAGLITEENSFYILCTFVGDAGFYFLPIFVGYSASRKLQCNTAIGMLLGAVMIHPVFLNIAAEGMSFNVYGIPGMPQNYTSTVIPMLLVIWTMSYVEKFLKKYVPDVLKVFLIQFGTLMVMLPLALCILGPAGAFVGNYICDMIISVNSIAGPLGVAIVGAVFSILVMTGMHPVLFTYLFVTFPQLGYDNFLIPGILACSWAGTGVAFGCAFKFKKKENRTLALGYIFTWFFGGVGEPLLYGLNATYKTPLYACVISGFITGLAAGLMNLTAYILNTSNGMYLLPAFVGGQTSNYIALAVTLVVGLVSGFVTMLFMKLEEK